MYYHWKNMIDYIGDVIGVTEKMVHDYAKNGLFSEPDNSNVREYMKVVPFPDTEDGHPARGYLGVSRRHDNPIYVFSEHGV